jgi:antitoxin Phd
MIYYFLGEEMKLTENMISLKEVDRDFSKITALVNKAGAAIVIENNVPRYIVMEYPKEKNSSVKVADREEVLKIASKAMNKYVATFQALAE